MKPNHRRVLLAAGAAVMLALGGYLQAADGLFTCDVKGTRNGSGCTTVTAVDLATEIAGEGISSISNVTYTGDEQAAGRLQGGTGAQNIVGFDSGVILSTGRIVAVEGPNNSGTASTLFPDQEGDVDLTALSGYQTFDAAVLEFDFVPDKDKVFVQYVFASEEYNEFVNRLIGGKLFNDVFAFYLNGVNCATIEGLPVSIQTINGGGPGIGQPPLSHPELYVNNDVHPTSPLNTQMDGLTKVLTCQASVMPNQVNHIKLAIADASDRRQDSNVILRAASFTTTPPLTILKKTNATNNDTGPAPLIHVGDPVEWSYVVTNSGFDPLTSVTVTDDRVGPITCPATTLPAPPDPGATMTCYASGTAGTGDYANIGTVVGMSSLVGPITDTNPDRYFGADPHIQIVTKTNQTDNDDAPGPYVHAGEPVTWTYEVTNTGNVTLDNVVVSDPGATIDCSLMPGGTPKTTLMAGEMMVCSATGLAVPGQYENTGTVTASIQVLNTQGGLETVTVPPDSNPDHYFGADPKLAIVKQTDGTDNNASPGLLVLAGDPIRWSYEVTNTGNVALTDVHVEDPSGTTVCTIGALAVGQTSAACTVPDGTAAKGQQMSTGHAVSAFAVVTTDGSSQDVPVTASDDEYYFGAEPQLAIVKKTNGTDNNAPPGLYVLVGDTVHGTYDVTNSGNVALTDVRVEDPSGTTVCTIAELAVGATYSACPPQDQIALRDQQNSAAHAAATLSVVTLDGSSKDVPVTAGDDEFYFGVYPHVALVKKTNGIDSSQAPGPVILSGSSVTWTYSVTNDGNVPLANLAVTDDKEGSICSIASIAVGGTSECAKTGVALDGPYANSGTATASVEVVRSGGVTSTIVVTAADSDYYFGADPRIAIVKKTVTFRCEPSGGSDDGRDGGTGRDGHDREDDRDGKKATTAWIAGSVDGRHDGSDHEKGDEKGDGKDSGHGGPKHDGSDKSHDGDMGCGSAGDWDTSWDGRSHRDEDGKDHQSRDDSDFGGDRGFGKDRSGDDRGVGAHFDLARSFDFGGKSGFEAAFGSDKDHGSGNDDRSGKDYGSGKERGDRGRDGDDRDHGSGQGHDSGGQKLIRVETDNNVAPGPVVMVGAKIGWTYTVTNTGNVPLTNVVVTDDKEGQICTIASLAVGQTAPACTKDGVAMPGQYENVGTATGAFGPVIVNGVSVPSVPVSASDVDHYFGGQATVAIVKTTNGTKNDTAPGPVIIKGSPVTWTYVVSNVGNLPLTDVLLIDDRVGVISCPSTTLTVLPDQGSTMTCSATGKAERGQYENTGTVTATSPFGPVTASDSEFYWGLDTKTYRSPSCR